MKLYLETSVWNFYYADDAPDKRDITREFFDGLGDHEIYISEVVQGEFDRATKSKQSQLNSLVAKYSVIRFRINDQVADLARDYIHELAMPPGSLEDALHAAIATINKIDVLYSWNMKHLANPNRMAKINEVNRKVGYNYELLITTPGN